MLELIVKIRYKYMLYGDLLEYIEKNNIKTDIIYAKIIKTSFLERDYINQCNDNDNDLSSILARQAYTVKLLGDEFNNMILTLYKKYIDLDLYNNFLMIYKTMKCESCIDDNIIKDTFYHILFFYHDEFYDTINEIIYDDKKIDNFSNIFTMIIQDALNRDKRTNMMLNYCKNFAKILEFNNKKSGMFYHCVGLFYQKTCQYDNAEKYFTIACIDDYQYMHDETAYASNASCVLRTYYSKSNDFFNNICKITNLYEELKASQIYHYLDILLKLNKIKD